MHTKLILRSLSKDKYPDIIVDRDPFTIGRTARCQVYLVAYSKKYSIMKLFSIQARIQDAYVSQIHLRIQFSKIDSSSLDHGMKAVAHDLSRNGTFVNNVKLVHDTTRALKAGDILSLIRGHMDSSSERPTFAYRGSVDSAMFLNLPI